MTVLTRFGGVSNVLISDGRSTILVDGYFSRPSLVRMTLGRIRPNPQRIERALARLDAAHIDSVLVSHSHADHALDAPVVAERTGAELAGTPSTRMIATGYGLATVPFRELRHGESFDVGRFTVTPLRALHSDGDRVPGEIEEPLRLPARMQDFKTGGCFSFHVAHPHGTVFVHPTANFVPGALAHHRADVVYLGAGSAGKKGSGWLEQYWSETVGTLGAGAVRPVHWDAFWRSLDRPLRRLPRQLDDLDATLASFRRLAGEHVDVALPALWAAEPVRPR